MINLDDLFKWKKELTIKDGSGDNVLVKGKPVKVYQRVIGDADLSTARKKGLIASGKLRKELKRTDSDTHIAMLPDYNSLDESVLRSMTVLADAANIRTEAIETYNKPDEPKMPDDPTLEEQEQYEVAMQEYMDAMDKSITKRMQEIMDQKTEALKQINKDELLERFLESLISSLCRNEMLRVFNSWCAFLGTYKDKSMKKHAFESYAAFDNATPELKEQIINSYITLDIGGEDIKN